MVFFHGSPFAGLGFWFWIWRDAGMFVWEGMGMGEGKGKGCGKPGNGFRFEENRAALIAISSWQEN